MDGKPMTLVAVGANLPGPWGGPLDACRRAAVELAHLPGLSLAGVSRWYRTAPVPASSQPDYVNGVVRLRGTVDPGALLASLHALERQAGRQRGVANAARTLDLDIIDMAGQIRASPDPVLPHPRARVRAFVLLPLQDVAPDWVHPGLEPGSGHVSVLLDRLRRESAAGRRQGCEGRHQPLGWPVIHE